MARQELRIAGIVSMLPIEIRVFFIYASAILLQVTDSGMNIAELNACLLRQFFP
jgi:hypothetical protein